MSHPIVVAMTGASGAIYATRLLELLRQMGRDVHLTISPPGALVIKHELNLQVAIDDFRIDQLLPPEETAFERCPATAASKMGENGESPSCDLSPGQLTYHHHGDFMAAIASGSSQTAGMVICPCSGSTLSAVVTGASRNLIHRAADVHLKERRRLVLVTRETPLSHVALRNMQRAGELGATIMPASPGWYHGIRSARDLVDFVVSRILDHLDLKNELIQRWGK